MFEFEPNTPMEFYKKTTVYTPGQGNNATWTKIVTGGFSVFFGEWRGSFGDRAVAAESIGVKDSATIRTHFNPTICQALKTEPVIIVKNADATAIVSGKPNIQNPNVYELWGGVDNVLEANRLLEFKVRRYEGK